MHHVQEKKVILSHFSGASWVAADGSFFVGYDAPVKSPLANTAFDHEYLASTNRPPAKQYLGPTT
jgi:hypothetical protein